MSGTKSVDGSDGLVLTPDHGITVCKSGSYQQKPGPKPQGRDDAQTTATSGVGVQPINQDGEIEVNWHD